jgi:hypothetical protein
LFFNFSQSETKIANRDNVFNSYLIEFYGKHLWKVLYQEEFEDTKGAIRIRKSKKDRKHNGQKKKIG